MESFSADWLALREPADHAARSAALAALVARQLDGGSRGSALDLAGGTGSNVRYLLPRLPAIRHWTLVDYDPLLLTRATTLVAPAAARHGAAFEAQQADLRDLETLPLGGVALVTASALLDLVSDVWLRRLAQRCREAGADVLFALSYDGGIAGVPEDDGDALVRGLVNRHQRTDKGFGPALGPDAAQVAAEAFRAEGYDVQTTESPWTLGPADAALQRPLIDGWAEAARAMSPADSAAIERWRTMRLAAVDNGTSRLRVGHLDVVATRPRLTA